MTYTDALNVRFDSDAGDNLTVREYLRELLLRLWDEGESFSGKQPFGNSGWEYDLYAPLVNAGILSGTLDDDGYPNAAFDEDEAHNYVRDLIIAVFAEGVTK